MQIYKFVRMISGHTTYSAEDWVELYYKEYIQLGAFPTLSFQIGICYSSPHSESASLISQILNWPSLPRIIQQQMDKLMTIVNRYPRSSLYNWGTFDQSNWEDLMPYVQLAMNTTVNASTNSSLYALLYGREAKTNFGSSSEEVPGFVENRTILRNEAAVPLRSHKLE